MMRKYHVRFLGGKEAVMPPTYPTGEDEDEDKGGRGSSLVGEFAEKKTRTTVFPLSEREKEIAERLNGKVLEDR